MVFDARNRAWVIDGEDVLVLDRGAETLLVPTKVGLRVKPDFLAAGGDGRVWLAGRRGGVQSFDGGILRTLPAPVIALRRLWPFSAALGAALWSAVLLLGGMGRIVRPGTAPTPPAPRGMWLRWLASSTIGFAIGSGAGLGIWLSRLAECQHDCDVVAFVLWLLIVIPCTVVLGGVIAAGIQYQLIFKGLVPGAGGWIVASASGLLVGAAILFLMFRLDTLPPALAVAGLLSCTGAVGLAQWVFLRKHVPRAGSWVAVTVFAFLPVLWFLIFEGEPLTTVRILTERGMGFGVSLAVAGAVMAGYGVWIGGIAATVGPTLLGTRFHRAAAVGEPGGGEVI